MKILFISSFYWKTQGDAEISTEIFLDTIYHTIYPDPCPFVDVLKYHSRREKIAEPPVALPRFHIIDSFVEKRVVTHVLRKSLKVLRILSTGKTYGEEKLPSELQICKKVFSLGHLIV
jgi:hypothetical protein